MKWYSYSTDGPTRCCAAGVREGGDATTELMSNWQRAMEAEPLGGRAPRTGLESANVPLQGRNSPRGWQLAHALLQARPLSLYAFLTGAEQVF